MSEKRYIVTENQIFKSIRFALESRIQLQSFVECIMDDIETILDFDCFEEYKESEEPCEDCISRQAVLDIVRFEEKWLFDTKSDNKDTKIAFGGIKSKVAQLPSVTPKTETPTIIEADRSEEE